MIHRRAALRVLMCLGLVGLVGLGAPRVAADAGGHPHARPNLKHTVPLRIVNSTLAGNQGDTGDDQTGDLPGPNLSALCQSFIGKPNPYPNPAPNVDEINGDAVVQAGSQAGCSAAQNETTIVVNPSNPRNVVGGANDYRVFNPRENRNDASGYAYTSFDGGATWTNVQLPHLTFQTGATGSLSDMDGAGDPSLSFGPNNTVYYANLVFSRSNDGSGIVVSISHDGGLTWSEPSIVRTDGVDANGSPIDTSFSNDKEWVAASPTDSKTAYVTWTQYGPSGSPIVFSVTHDGGATWSAPAQVTPAFTAGGITPYDQGSIPQVGNNGALYVAYEGAVCQTLDCDQPTDHDAVIMAKSTNGGQSFVSTEVSVDYDFPFNVDTFTPTLTGENFRINSFPQFTIDRADGRLYLTWADDRNGQYDAQGSSIKSNGDIFVTSSGNGTQWSQISQIGSSADEVFPAIAAYNGRIALSFYTRAYDSGGIGLDYAYAVSNGLGNLKRAAVTRITTQSENPQVQFVGIGFVSGDLLQGEFIGDYTAVAMGTDLRFHPSWTDFRGNPGVNAPNQDAYTQSIPAQ